MFSGFELGIPGVTARAGDHICAFYRGEAGRDEMLLPFLIAGLQQGQKVNCVLDRAEPEHVLAQLAGQADVEQVIAGHQLDIFSSGETYLVDGCFSSSRMIDFWLASVTGGLDHGFSFVRSIGEMTWALRDVPGADELAAYEAELNRFLPKYPQVILCLYDLDRFDGEIVVEVLKTHPWVLLSGVLLENPYYLAPDEYLASRRRP